MAVTDLEPTFARLRQVLAPFLDRTRVKVDDATQLYLEVPGTPKPEMLAAVMLKKASVSFHYLPVYTDPALLDEVSPELRRRMQGKSCFSFSRPDDPAIEELERFVATTAPRRLDAAAGEGRDGPA